MPRLPPAPRVAPLVVALAAPVYADVDPPPVGTDVDEAWRYADPLAIVPRDRDLTPEGVHRWC